ncbi:MAG: DmpA family aminopeptidase [Candidatus Flexifilum sp.]
MRLRDLGLTPGRLPTGPLNAITDVPGVRVGHVTLIAGDGPLVEGRGPVRTGVTAILPHEGSLFRSKVAAGVHTINGFGKAAGFEQIRETGLIETPIVLTNTLSVGRAVDALTTYMLRTHPEIGLTTGTVSHVVGECNDGFLNDIRGRHVHSEHVIAAIESAAGGPVAEGNVGAGTGTACFQFKGGIGTASRRAGDFTVGALVQTNYGQRAELLFMGAPIGLDLAEELLPVSAPPAGGGSILIVLATDAPLDARQLTRLAVRAGFGLARTGAAAYHESGDFVIAFSTTTRRPHQPERPVGTGAHLIDGAGGIDPLFTAVIESVEEAILNALVAAETLTGRDGHTLYALPHDRLLALLRRYGRL